MAVPRRLRDQFKEFLEEQGEDVDATLGSLGVGELSGAWDHKVTSADELESLAADTSPYDTVRVEQPDTPFVISSQIVVDHALTIEFESPYAKDGAPAIKVADNANVGGIRFGINSSVPYVRVVNYGYDGNAVELDANGDPTDMANPTYNQDQTVKYLDGIVFDQVEEFEMVGGYLRNTSPFHEHGTGGSLVTATGNASNGSVRDVRGEWPGDRCFQFGGEDISVSGLRATDGFDRFVAADMEFDGVGTAATSFTARDCHCRDLHEGSAFGASNATDISFVGCTAKGIHRCLLRFYNCTDATAEGCRGYAYDLAGNRVGLDHGVGVMQGNDGVSISDAKVDGYPNSSLFIDDDAVDVTVRDLVGLNSGDRGIRAGGTDVRIFDPTIAGSGAVSGGANEGINIVGDVLLLGGEFRQNGANGIFVNNSCTIKNVTVSNNGQGGGFNEVFTNAANVVLKNVDVASRNAGTSFRFGANATGLVFHNCTAPSDGSEYSVDASATFASKAANFPVIP